MKKLLSLSALLFLLASMEALAQDAGGVNYGVSVSGVVTPNDCVKFQSPWVIQDAGTTCGGGGSVSVTAGSSNIVINPTPGTGTFTVDTGASPTFATSVTTPLVIGGTGAASTLTLESTSGAGTTDAILFKTASQSEKMRILSNGLVAIGTTTPTVGGLQVTGVGNSFPSIPPFLTAALGHINSAVGPNGDGFLFTNSTSGSTAMTMIFNGDIAYFDSINNSQEFAWGEWNSTGLGLGINFPLAPVNRLDVSGGVAIGTQYASVSTAPVNGLIVSGNVGIGTATIQNSAALQVNGTIESGVSGSTLGSVLLAGNTGGLITVKSQAAAGTYNFNLPITAGSSGQAMLSGGGSSTAMTWGTVATGSGGTPTCGTGCASVTAGSTDLRGSMVSGSSVSAVTLNFSGTLTSAPFCTISDSNTSATADISSISTSALTVSLASALTSVTIYWNCPL